MESLRRVAETKTSLLDQKESPRKHALRYPGRGSLRFLSTGVVLFLPCSTSNCRRLSSVLSAYLQFLYTFYLCFSYCQFPFFAPHRDWDGRRGLQRGVHVVSRGISICYPDRGSPQEIQNYLRHREMELSKFWKEN